MTPRAATPIILAFALALAACGDPGVHIAWQTQIKGPIDRACLKQALQTVAPNVRLSDYVSDGSPFPRGTKAFQLWYDAPPNTGDFHTASGYRIDLAPLPNGDTGYFHGWTTLGTDIPSARRDYVLAVMRRANAAIAARCGISLGAARPEQGLG
jgi:hypothetical protein